MRGFRTATGCGQAVSGVRNEMMSSGVLPQDMLSTNTLRVVSGLHLSLCHVKEVASNKISDADLDQLCTEDIVTEAQEKRCALLEDKNQSSHLEDPLDIIKEEADDVESDAEFINLEDENIKIEEICWEPDIASPTLQFANNILCPKIVKVVLERIDLNDFLVEDLKQRRRATQKISIEAISSKLNRNKEAETEFGEPRSAGAPVSKQSTIAVLEDAEDATTNKIKIEVIKNEQTESISFIEPKIVTKKTEIKKPGTTSLILETSVVISVVNDVCEQKSTNNTSLEQNVGSVSRNKGKLFSCDICNKSFSYKHTLVRHIRSHTSEKPYQCNVCKKCFTRNGNLQTHLRMHSGEKPYQCNVCKECFRDKDYFKRHVRTHTNDKQYECNVCKKCWPRKSDLERHIRTHTSEKPYQCNVCEKCFTQKSDLERHNRIHSGEKPYQCNVCNKCFTQKCSLKRHNIRAHTSEKQFQCNIYKKCFTKKGNFKKHNLTHL